MEKLNISSSILSGILIGIGVIINTFSSNKYVGAMLFSLALLSIIELKLQLFTGKIGYCINNKMKISSYILILLYHCIGIIIPLFLFIISADNYKDYINIIINISNNKFNHSYIYLFINGIMCGILIFIAVYCKKTIITIFCIMTFILSGYEHCIADFPFLFFNFSFSNFIKYIFIIIGNSVGAIITNYLIIKAGDKQ